MQLQWYCRRLLAMSPAEVVVRARHHLVQRRWRSRQVRRMAEDPALHCLTSGYAATAGRVPSAGSLPAQAVAAMLEAAEELLDGRWTQFGILRTDLVDPDWFLDPTSARRAPAGDYAFAIPFRDQHAVGNIKHVWELSRHHHLTLLATAWHVTREERFAARVAVDLRSWWDANPFLSGVHWISGIELGIRLISWTWTRRLLADWPGVRGLFDENPVFLAQVHHHLEFLDALHSTGSSANNHVIAEAAGLVVGGCAYPCFPESPRWRERGLDLLVRQLGANTFPSGLNRELATEYHGLVLELALVAAVELEAAARARPPAYGR